MATTPYFFWAPQASSAAAFGSDITGFGARETETTLAATAATETALASPEVAAVVAQPRLRRQSSGSGKQQAGGNKKPPQRGLGVAELERLRCGGDPLHDINAAVVAAAMGDAANVQGHSVLHHHHLPASAFDAGTSARNISPLLVQSPPAPPAPPAPVCYVQSASSGGQSVAPEQQYYMDRWGRMGGFAPVGNAGAGHQPHLPPLAPEHPSSQRTIWRPVSSSSCLHTGHRCDLCSRTMRALTEKGARTPAAIATTTMPDYSIYDLAAAMATARKEKGEGFLAWERKEAAEKKEVREIEFFPTSTNHSGGVDPDEAEFATMGPTPFSSSSGGGCTATAPLDLSLRL